ncbi:hypothetical protein B296_00029698 [Ensete ventricosum]|uniref:Uncharacterized protein n=1 Tax=Ensete ventricosum TaxID=4639 RepID=A0A426Z3I6_ENSVE|nr:hypothetical protein B296_00029698 [Ensete ventricosum]
MTPASSKTRAKAPASSGERATPILSHASRSCEYPITSSPSFSSFCLSDSTFTSRISRFASANVIDSAEPLPPAPALGEGEGEREPESERDEQKRMARGRDGRIERFAGLQLVVPSEPPRRVRKRERADEEEERHIAMVRCAMGRGRVIGMRQYRWVESGKGKKQGGVGLRQGRPRKGSKAENGITGRSQRGAPNHIIVTPGQG